MVTTLAGNGTLNAAGGFSDATGTNAMFNNPIDVAVDSFGNVYVADQGNHRIRKITQAGVVSTFAGYYNGGYSDATGTNALFTNPSSLSLDSSGNVYVADSGNHLIRKITPAGTVSTLAGQTTAGFSDGQGTNAMFGTNMYGLAIDVVNNLYITDYNNYRIRKIMFPTPITSSSYTLPTPSSTAAYAIKYNSTGSAQWVTAIDGTGAEQTNNVTLDTSGNIFVSGQYSTASPTIYNASSTSTTNSGLTLATPTGTAGFAVKYNPSGAAQWAVAIDGTGTDIALATVTDTSKNLILVGSYTTASPTIYNAGNSASSYTLPTPTGTAAFVVKYNSSGSVQWVAAVDGTGNETANSLCTDSSGSIYISGVYTSASPTIYNANATSTAATTANGPTPLTLPAPSSGSSAAYVIKYNSSGVAQWAAAIDGAGTEQGNGITVDSTGNVYVGGQYSASATVYNNQNVAAQTLMTPSGVGSFLVKYSAPTTTLAPYNLILNLGSANNGLQKVLLNASACNVTLNVTNSNNSSTISSATIVPNQSSQYVWYGTQWFKQY